MRLEEKKIKQRMSIFSVSLCIFFSCVLEFGFLVSRDRDAWAARSNETWGLGRENLCNSLLYDRPKMSRTHADSGGWDLLSKKDDRTVECAGRARARWTYSNLLLTLVIDMLSYFIVPFSGSKRPRPQKELYKRTVECSVNGFTASFPEGMQTEVFHFLSPR